MSYELKGRQVIRIEFDLLATLLGNGSGFQHGIKSNLPADARIIGVGMDIRDHAYRTCTIVCESEEWKGLPTWMEPEQFCFEYTINQPPTLNEEAKLALSIYKATLAQYGIAIEMLATDEGS
jgi:hypothetical protein